MTWLGKNWLQLLLLAAVVWLIYRGDNNSFSVGDKYINTDTTIAVYNITSPKPVKEIKPDTSIIVNQYYSMDSAKLVETLHYFLTEYYTEREYADSTEQKEVKLKYTATVQGNELTALGWELQNMRIAEHPDLPRRKFYGGIYSGANVTGMNLGLYGFYINKNDISISAGYDPLHQSGFIGMQKLIRISNKNK